jgi:hypothetical protein
LGTGYSITTSRPQNKETNMQQQLTSAGENIVNDLSYRYNLSHDAIIHMIGAVNNGGGSMAQFNCPELGGSGQWMRGGMTMVGDMFNNGLKNTVNNLCSEISNILQTTQIFPVIPAGTKGSAQWWPAELGSPFSSGSQNSTRYAIFAHRLAVEINGEVTVYDTLDNNIGGVSQQQGGDNSLTFSSQYGTILVSSLPVVSGAGSVKQAPQAPQSNFAQAPTHEAPKMNIPTDASADSIIQLIDKLSKLRDAGALTDQEFNSKKVELLNRL